MKKTIVLMFVLAILSGCAASGAKLSNVESLFPQVEPSKARVYFYRIYNTYGSGMRQDILIDGVVVGKSIPGGVFYSDVSAGQHVVTIPRQLYSGQSTLNISVKPGEVKYVKTWIGGSGFGGRTNIAIAPEEEARSAISELAFTGNAK